MLCIYSMFLPKVMILMLTIEKSLYGCNKKPMFYGGGLNFVENDV